jgi:peptidoglycan/LPS O-acetylase OafA/YrhL
MNKKQRIYQIDLFRFIAALSVVFYHYLFRGYAADNMSVLSFTEIGNYFKYGYLGVDLFFIISGFVIILSIKNYSLSAFITSRITRLYPAYWFCVLLTSIVVVYFGSPWFHATVQQMLANLTMFHQLFFIDSIDGVYWSLLVELKFYFIIALFLIFVKIKKLKIDVLVYSWLFLTILYFFTSDYLIMKAFGYFLIFDWSSYFIAGIIFYQIYKNDVKIQNILALIVCLLISLFYAINRIDEIQIHYSATFSPYIISSIIVSFYVLMYLVSIGKLRGINSPKLLKLGVLTYPLYLLHQNIGFIIFNNLGTYFNKYIIFFLTLVVIFIASYYTNKLIEIPVSRFMKNKLEKFMETSRNFYFIKATKELVKNIKVKLLS